MCGRSMQIAGLMVLRGELELLQRMPIFGGVRADTLQFLLAFCLIVSVPTNEFRHYSRAASQGLVSSTERGTRWSLL